MNWFFSSGDGPFFYPEQIKSLSWWPKIMDFGRGFGESRLPILWLEYPFQVIVKALSFAGLSWFVIEKLIWLGAWAVCFTGAYRLGRFLRLPRLISTLTAVIYATNTYALMIFGGGLIGLFLGYSLFPFVLVSLFGYIYKTLVENDTLDEYTFKDTIRDSLYNGLLMSVLCMLDIRIAVLTLGVGIFYTGFLLVTLRNTRAVRKIFRLITSAGVSMLVILCTHVYWILPSLQSLSKSFLADPVYTGSGMVSFLSFADFSHALSLLHPNWPENLFGKVYFLQPEFLVVPILAFSSLLFVDISKHRKDSGGSIKYQVSSIEYETKYVIPKTTYFVQFFALLALVGVLLAKGAREPFGGIYVWLFDHVLGFVMFRDPTKFYVLSAISYALLIPFTLQQIASAISIRYQVSLLRPQKRNFGGQASIKYKKIIPNTLYVILTTLFIVYWCFTIRPLFLGDLSGNFKPQTIPFEYEKLKDMLVADTNPSRTLWIPQQDIFAYLSKQHPLLSGTTLFQNASQSGLVNRIRTPAFLRDISVSGVRYIIVPIDIEKRIFLSDYRYDPGIREQLIQVLAESGLRRLPEFTDTAVFENPAFTFTRDVSLSVAKQESLSRIGVLLSLTSWLFCLTILICTKRKYGR